MDFVKYFYKAEDEKWFDLTIIYVYSWNIIYGSLTIETGQILGIKSIILINDV